MLKPEIATPVMWLNYLWRRIHRLQFNLNMIVTGDTGSGKTMFAITIAYLLNRKRFNANFYTNSIKDFLDIVENSHKGDTVVFDETGANLSAREWYSIGNILAGQALQTYRKKNLATFFCTPDPSFTDVQLRRLLNCFVIMKRYGVNESYADIRKVRVDRTSGNVSWPQFDFFFNGRRYKISRIKFTKTMLNLVPKKMLDEIEEKDSKFKSSVLRKARMQAQEVEECRLGISKTNNEMADEIMSHKEDYLYASQDPRFIGKINWKLIAADYKLSRDRAQTILSLIRRKIKDV